MNSLIPSAITLPAPLQAAGQSTQIRFLEFFTANIRNPNTRKAYGNAVGLFLSWCAFRGVESLPDIQPIHVAAWMEEALAAGTSAAIVKQRLANVRTLFDCMAES